jgi:GNAT superfamily N-acetyltransferase
MRTFLERINELVPTETGIKPERMTLDLTWYSKSRSRAGSTCGRRGNRLPTSKLTTMPGCCGIVISTNAYVYPDYRGKGLGHLLNRMRQQIAYEWGYGLIFATVTDDNFTRKTTS